MKKQFLAIIFSVFLAGNALAAAIQLTSGISYSDFENAFNTQKVWYAQIQAGITGTSIEEPHEFEFGGSGGTLFENDPYHTGDTNWTLGSNHSFEITSVQLRTGLGFASCSFEVVNDKILVSRI